MAKITKHNLLNIIENHPKFNRLDPNSSVWQIEGDLKGRGIQHITDDIWVIYSANGDRVEDADGRAAVNWYTGLECI